MYEPNTNAKWWMSDKNAIYQDVFSVVKHLEKDQSYRADDNLRNARLYGNLHLRGLGVYTYSKPDSSIATSHRVTLNVIQSQIDTVVSKITKSKVRPQFLTEAGNHGLKTKAKKLTKFIDGIFTATDFYTKSTMAFLDSCIFGTGAIKIFESNGNIKAERVFINELLVSDVEAYYGEPRQMHQVKHIHKDLLKEMFPNHAVMIDQANIQEGVFPSSTRNRYADDMIKVVESWHLPSGPDAKDGVHSICIENLTLLKEEYNRKIFPFVFFRWNVRPIGFFGAGLSEQLQGLQLEINKILRTIQVSMHLVSIPKLLVEASSKIVSAHLNNKIGGVIKFAGTPPTYTQLGQIPGELFNHLENLYQKSYEISGISQLSAQSVKQPGLESGKALRTMSDIESERFLAVASRYERSFIDAAKLMIIIAKEIYADDKDFGVQVKGKDFIETIKWKDVDLEEDQFMLDVFPTNALSRDPAGRLADIQDLIAAGMIDEETGRNLLDFPDLQGTMNMLNADSQNLDKLIEKMIDDGEYFPPEPYQNLENALRKTQQAYLMYRMQGVSEDRLDLLRRYMEDTQGLLFKAQPETPTSAQQAEELAIQGAPGAAEAVAEQANLGQVPLNPLVEGGLALGDNAVQPEMSEEELMAAEEEQALLAEEELL